MIRPRWVCEPLALLRKWDGRGNEGWFHRVLAVGMFSHGVLDITRELKRDMHGDQNCSMHI